ncbi:MAG TPA: HlyD family secretion protein [Gammaproteobacteria bacterium]|nr:HlyD family secretion protein [Gammaproteobacteria bacterium]
MNPTAKKFWLVSASILLLATLAYFYSLYTTYYPSTDDAYIQADVVNVAAQVTGRVDHIYVADHQFVKKGQLLFSIDPNPFEIALRQAQSTVEQIQAQTDTQAKDTARILPLVTRGALPKSAGDDAQGQLDQLRAALKVAEAQLATAQINLLYTQIYAPNDGYITNFILRQGQVIQATTPQFALVENKEWWINANFKETDLGRIKSGQSAKISIDIYPGITFKGIVQGVSRGSGAVFSLLPPEDATGNWVKVTQRFPVRVDFVNPDPKYPLRMGASGTVTVNTH